MPLNYELTKIADYETVCWIDGDEGRRLNPATEVLVFATMSTGINHITERNVEEFYARFDMLQRIHGCFLVDGSGEQRRIEPQEVKVHIGLATNASTKTRAAFLRDLGGILDDGKRAYRAFTREPAAA
jgi:hypothetical protein